MSRYGDEGEEEFPGQAALYQRAAHLALTGKRGRKALADLRDALRALPEPVLIARAVCTVAPEKRAPERRPDAPFGNWAADEFAMLVAEEGQGVCAVGAYVWWQKVKAGAAPDQAFAELPTLDDYNHDSYETAQLGQQHGLTMSLAHILAYRNDETYDGATPGQRYQLFMRWLDNQLDGDGSAP